MEVPNIPGLTKLEGPQMMRMAGSKFALPPSFDARRFASKWVEQGPQVQEAMQPQIIQSANVAADGWQVFKVLKVTEAKRGTADEKSQEQVEAELAGAKAEESEAPKKKPEFVPCVRAVGKAIYVLMYRPRELQRAVNVLYANQSRELVGKEVMGETNAVNASQDHGVLSNQELMAFKKNFEDEVPKGYLPKADPSAQRPAEAVELNLQPV